MLCNLFLRALIWSSAGAGRTGVFIGTHIAMEMGVKEGQVDLVHTVNQMREQRMKMIQSEVLLVIFSVTNTCA